ncbi:MAG: HEAT repeat domain-containing protein [Balneolaceae bacterium]|nr:HEAT repeat domain-containing protein [Balneolaceae bacterium]
MRKKAQFEIASRQDTESFGKALDQENPQLQRIHGIWGLAQIGRHTPDAVKPLIFLLKDDDSEIRAQAAKMLGDVRYEPAGDALIPLLKDENIRVRFFAAEALGRLSWQPAIEPIIEMLEVNNDEDVYLRHGGAIALARIGDVDALAELSDHHSRAVRIAAVVALRRLEDPGVIRFLEDEDEFVVTNAARAINDDAFIEEGIEALAGMVEQNRFKNEPLMRRAINANLYLGTTEAAQRLAEFALRKDIPAPLRVEAMQTLSVWPESSSLDRVTGDPRGEVENNPEDARQAIAQVIDHLLEGAGDDLKIASIEAVGSLEFEPAIPQIMNMVGADSSPEVRIASLQTLVDMEYDEIEDAVFTALEDEEQRVRMNALRKIPNLDLPKENIVALIEPVLERGTVDERQVALSTLGQIDDPSAYQLLDRYLQLLINGELDREVELELVQAAESAESETVQEKLQAYQLNKSENDSVSVYRELLYGGDAESGRRIFYQNDAGQCIRCHVINGEGGEAGPDLSSIGSQLSREELLRAMIRAQRPDSPGFWYCHPDPRQR